MLLWTHHPSYFEVDKATEIDPTKGPWWNYDDPQFRYREVLPKLCEMLGTPHFLWCCCTQGEWLRMTEEDDCVEWQLDVPTTSVLSLYSTKQWDLIVYSKTDDWSGLLVPISTEPLTSGIGALVSLPLPPASARCLGPLPVKYPKGSRGRGE